MATATDRHHSSEPRAPGHARALADLTHDGREQDAADDDQGPPCFLTRRIRNSGRISAALDITSTANLPA